MRGLGPGDNQVTASKGDECWPVGIGCVAAGVLTEAQVPIDARCFDGRKHGCFEARFAEQTIDRAGGDGGHEHAFGVGPAITIGGSAADEQRPRRGKSDELVRVDWKVAPLERAGVLEEVTCHPVILPCRGDILDDLAPVASVEFGSAFAGRTDVADGEASVIGHGDESGLAPA